MEDPCDLLSRVLAFADAREQIVAVIQTGSRARGYGVDAFSDLDIELIGPGTAELVGNDEWPGTIADVLVSLHLANEGPDDPDWPTCLVVFAGGRKVDFTLADIARIERMKHKGLDTLYQRGYLVHRDKAGITNGFPAAMMVPPDKPAPTAGEFEANQREFWFEATQVPIYLVRGDLWPAASRQSHMRTLLLTMLEWNTVARSQGTIDIWHHGHHLDEWLPEHYHARIAATYSHYEAADALRALHAMIDLYAGVVAETGQLASLPALNLHTKVLRHINAVTNTSGTVND